MTTDSDDRESLGSHIGRNAQLLRDDTGVSRDELARLVRQLTGAPWTASRVGTIETGHGTPGIPTVLTYCAALNFARAVNGLLPVGLPDFFATGVEVAVTDHFTLGSSELKAVFGGAPVQAATMDDVVSNMTKAVEDMHAAIPEGSRLPGRYRTTKARTGLVMLVHTTGGGDKRAADSLGINIYELTAWSRERWGTTFSQERDRRAGPGASPQQRGKVSRELMAELKTALEQARKD